MRYITHEFAHPETLDRVRRWLIEVGFDASRIVAHAQGTPRLAVAVDPGEAAEVAMLIDTAEASDPDGFPSFLQPSRHQHVDPGAGKVADPVEEAVRSVSFVIGWQPLDRDRGPTQGSSETDLQRAYQERWE